MSLYYKLEPHTTLVVRDNRFSGDSTMHSSEWVLPSVMAGSVRTVIGKARGRYDHAALRAIAVAGPFPLQGGQLGFFPPADRVELQDDADGSARIFPLKPLSLPADQGCDLPDGLRPCAMPEDAPKGKPLYPREFWSMARMEQWLLNHDAQAQSTHWPAFPMPVFETRTHLEIDPETLASVNGKLFSCTGLAIPHAAEAPYQAAYQLAVRIEDNKDLQQALIHPVGGERRLTVWEKELVTPMGWSCPVQIANALQGARKVRLVLASPGIFGTGWKPTWLDSRNEGIVPGTSVRVKLESACIQRWKAISGWSYEHKGPKAIRRMVPAGSVYFFSLLEGAASELAHTWMQSVGDEGQDGFGLALWGIWN